MDRCVVAACSPVRSDANSPRAPGRTHKFNVLASAKKICQQMDEMELHGRMTVEVVAQGKEPSFLFKKLSAE